MDSLADISAELVTRSYSSRAKKSISTPSTEAPFEEDLNNKVLFLSFLRFRESLWGSIKVL